MFTMSRNRTKILNLIIGSVLTVFLFSTTSANSNITFSDNKNVNFPVNSQTSFIHKNMNSTNEIRDTNILLSNGTIDYVNNVPLIPIKNGKIVYKINLSLRQTSNGTMNYTISALFTPIVNTSNLTTIVRLAQGLVNTNLNISDVANYSNNKLINTTSMDIYGRSDRIINDKNFNSSTSLNNTYIQKEQLFDSNTNGGKSLSPKVSEQRIIHKNDTKMNTTLVLRNNSEIMTNSSPKVLATNISDAIKTKEPEILEASFMSVDSEDSESKYFIANSSLQKKSFPVFPEFSNMNNGTKQNGTHFKQYLISAKAFSTLIPKNAPKLPTVEKSDLNYFELNTGQNPVMSKKSSVKLPKKKKNNFDFGSDDFMSDLEWDNMFADSIFFDSTPTQKIVKNSTPLNVNQTKNISANQTLLKNGLQSKTTNTSSIKLVGNDSNDMKSAIAESAIKSAQSSKEYKGFPDYPSFPTFPQFSIMDSGFSQQQKQQPVLSSLTKIDSNSKSMPSSKKKPIILPKRSEYSSFPFDNKGWDDWSKIGAET